MPVRAFTIPENDDMVFGEHVLVLALFVRPGANMLPAPVPHKKAYPSRMPQT